MVPSCSAASSRVSPWTQHSSSGQPVLVGQGVQLVVQHRRGLPPATGPAARPSPAGPLGGLGLAGLPAAGVRPAPDRDPVGDREQPPAERGRGVHRLRLLQQHEERGLEGVVDVGRVGQHLPARREHGLPVPGDEGAERVVVAVPEEPVEQVAVARPRGRPSGGPTAAACGRSGRAPAGPRRSPRRVGNSTRHCPDGGPRRGFSARRGRPASIVAHFPAHVTEVFRFPAGHAELVIPALGSALRGRPPPADVVRHPLD